MKTVIILSVGFFVLGCALIASQDTRSWEETNFISGSGALLCMAGLTMPLILSFGSQIIKWLKK